ncbi:MFS transporter [Glycomyces sp. NPDC046736]|uniref:MFS transporter n=1 Tax=Glycomyces sp. NPDC046736 TaxID=3155615 RepID=UPI00340515B7
MSQATELDTAAPRTGRAPAVALAALAGPMSFGITGPALVLGDIARDLDVTIPAATTVVTAFGWGIAVGTPTMGALLTRYGPRVALSLCSLLIAAGAALVLAVPALPALVVGSGLQALGSAGMVVVAMSLAASPAAMGAVTSSLAGVGAVAPLIGIQVSAALSWQAVLAMTLLSLIAVPFVLRSVGRGTEVEAPRFDAWGALLLTALVTALVFVPQRPLPALVAVAVTAVLLAAHLRRRPHGFVPADLLANRVFAASAGIAFVLAVANFGIVYAAPGRLGDLTAWTPGQLGLAVAVPYLFGGVTSWLLVARSARLRYPTLITALLLASAAAVAAVTLGNALVPLLFAGMATGSLAAATGQGALALRATKSTSTQSATAMGLFNLCYLLGAAFGPAIAALAV